MSEESEDPSALFQSLLGEVSEEQWETYMELKKARGGLVCSDTSDSSEPESRSESPAVPEGMFASLEEPLSELAIGDEEASDSDSAEDDYKPTSSLWATDLTVKYIDGELSFSEFTEIMEKDSQKTGVLSEIEDEMEDLDTQERNEAEQKLEEEIEEHKKRHKRGRKIGHLPKDLQGLMGEANLCFARGDQEDAIKMCMEVIRLAPRAAAPFQTLSMIYEDMGDTEKAFQFSLIGAYLSPRDLEEWMKLAQMCLERENIKQAICCYSQAIQCNSKDINLHWERCNLYEQVGDRKKALIGYEAILELLGSDQNEECIQLSRELAKIHHENGDDAAAAQVLAKAAGKCASLITSEDINMLLELQIGQKLYENAVMILWQHCGVTFHDSEKEIENFCVEQLHNVKECKTPEALPIDLQIKLAVCLINLKASPLVLSLLMPLFQESPEEMGDLYLDVAEAYMAVGEYKQSLPIFDTLLHSKNYSMAAVWLRYAECMNAIGDIEAAVKAYEQVVKMAPTHYGARMSHSTLLQQLGRTQEAITTLVQNMDCEEGKIATVDVQLLYMRCNLLASQGMWEEYLKEAKLLLSSVSYPISTPAEIRSLFNSLSTKRRVERMRELKSKFDLTKDLPTFVNMTIQPEDLWSFYLKVLGKLYELKRMNELQYLAIQGMTCTIFYKQLSKSRDILFLALLGCYYNRNAEDAYILVRELALKEVHRPRVWNLFSQVVMLLQDVRHNRFCLRLTCKFQDHIALGILNGNNAMVSGSYKHALGEYMGVFKQCPDDPFLALCVGLTFINIAAQKFTDKRHSLVLQGCAFLHKYQKMRGECQESYYNLGRAMHGLGLLHLAVHCYKKALEFPSAIEDESGIFDLSAEIGYNLSLIYRGSGVHSLALYYLRKYCVI